MSKNMGFGLIVEKTQNEENRGKQFQIKDSNKYTNNIQIWKENILSNSKNCFYIFY